MPISPILFETHSHTPLCKHAVGEPSEYAAQAYNRGLKGIAVTCHNPIPDGYSANVRMSEGKFGDYVEMVRRAGGEWEGVVEVVLGLETDFVPGMEEYIRELHTRADFQYIIGSVHPQVPDYQARFFTGDIFQYQKTYFRHLAEAAESGLFDSISHPDLIKNIDPQSYDLERLMPIIRESLDRIAVTGVAMELNTSGAYKTVPEMNPAKEILSEMFLREIPVVIGADAHHPKRVGDRFSEALRLLREVGFEEVCYFLERTPQRVPISEALASLSENRELPGESGASVGANASSQ